MKKLHHIKALCSTCGLEHDVSVDTMSNLLSVTVQCINDVSHEPGKTKICDTRITVNHQLGHVTMEQHFKIP